MSDPAAHPERPRANFLFHPAAPRVAEPVRFVDVTQEEPAGEVSSRSWRFGDGGTGRGVAPTHRFSRAGDYVVELRVVMREGTAGVVARTVQVR